MQDQLYIPIDNPSFEIKGTFMFLQPRFHPPGKEGEDWIGMTLHRVHIVSLARGANHGSFKVLFFVGILRDLLFDPGRWK